MQITKDQIEDAAASVGIEVRDDYSGRSMYGDTCVGVVCEPWEREGFVRTLADLIAEEEFDGEQEPEDVDEIAEQIEAKMSADNMGLSIILFFRSVKS